MNKRKIWALACLLAALALPAAAADISTYSFNSGLNCNGVYPLPDTGQTQCYDKQPTPVAGACPGGGNGLGPAGQDGAYAPAAVQPRYTIQSPGGTSSTTVDNVTGLMWITNPVDAGLSGTYTWQNALNACENQVGSAGTYAGYSDWRLPNIKELAGIVDFSRQNPAVDPAYFPNTQTANPYWSATTYVPSTGAAWTVGFNGGNMSSTSKTNYYYVRCVRGGP